MERKPSWNEETIYALNLHKTVFGLIGTWPFDVGNLSSKLRWSLIMLIQMSTISSLSLEVYRHCLDLDDTMDAFIMDLSALVTISKLLFTRLNYRHIRSLLSSIIEDLSNLEDSNEREIVMKYTTRGKIVSLSILYLAYASGISFLFKNLPLHYFLSQNIDRNETYNVNVTSYFLSTYCVFKDQSGFWRTAILLLQTIEIFVNQTSHCGNDGFFFVLAMHLCGQFEVLRMNFANLGTKEDFSRKKIGALVRRHCRLIRLADSLEEAFNMILLIQLLMSGLLLCIEGPYKCITWATGTWPLEEEGLFTMVRFGIVFALEFSILVSILMEIRSNCGTFDETLDFFGLFASSMICLSKLILTKLHQEDLRRIVLSVLNDWFISVDGSSTKNIMLKYTNRSKLVYRIQMSLGLVIITTMILDALPASESYLSDNSTSNEEIVKLISLKTMCLFGNMSTSTYWTVFVLQGVQLLNAVLIDCGYDVFFFGIAMHICAQFDALKIFCDELNVEDEENCLEKIREFVERHSYVLDIAHRFGNTLSYILLVILMGNGIHICAAALTKSSTVECRSCLPRVLKDLIRSSMHA
ncbi:odorant receptor 9a-like isoform X1 [Vespula squamosa]|uniref:Odorant receptor 9a-like isoform X1 n=1 Tax=Vespula squamosa TaxID=30214 RepID=A0ABD2BYT6_VESSQ